MQLESPPPRHDTARPADRGVAAGTLPAGVGVEPARAADPRNLTVPFRIRARREPGVQALGAVGAPQVPTVVGVVKAVLQQPFQEGDPLRGIQAQVPLPEARCGVGVEVRLANAGAISLRLGLGLRAGFLCTGSRLGSLKGSCTVLFLLRPISSAISYLHGRGPHPTPPEGTAHHSNGRYL